MNLERWDKEVGPKLAGVNFDARWIKFYAEKIEDRIKSLPCRPSFETNAEASIREAIETMKNSLARLDGAAREYAGKPIDE